MTARIEVPGYVVGLYWSDFVGPGAIVHSNHHHCAARHHPDTRRQMSFAAEDVLVICLLRTAHLRSRLAYRLGGENGTTNRKVKLGISA